MRELSAIDHEIYLLFWCDCVTASEARSQYFGCGSELRSKSRLIAEISESANQFLYVSQFGWTRQVLAVLGKKLRTHGIKARLLVIV